MQTQFRDLAAYSPEFCSARPALPNQRAQGMPGASMRPQPRVQMKKAHEQVTTVTPKTPGIPRAMVLTVSFVISPVIGLVCHRRQWNRFRPPAALSARGVPGSFAPNTEGAGNAGRSARPQPRAQW